MEEFVCLKDWKYGNTYHYTKGKKYKGKRNEDGSVEMIGNANFIKHTIHSWSSHFTI